MKTLSVHVCRLSPYDKRMVSTLNAVDVAALKALVDHETPDLLCLQGIHTPAAMYALKKAFPCYRLETQRTGDIFDWILSTGLVVYYVHFSSFVALTLSVVLIHYLCSWWTIWIPWFTFVASFLQQAKYDVWRRNGNVILISRAHWSSEAQVVPITSNWSYDLDAWLQSIWVRSSALSLSLQCRNVLWHVLNVHIGRQQTIKENEFNLNQRYLVCCGYFEAIHQLGKPRFLNHMFDAAQTQTKTKSMSTALIRCFVTNPLFVLRYKVVLDTLSDNVSPLPLLVTCGR